MAEAMVISTESSSNPFTHEDILKLKTEAGVFSKFLSKKQLNGTSVDIKHTITTTTGDDDDDSSEWIFLKKTDHVKLWKKSTEGSAVNLVKGVLHFPGIPPEDIYELIVNLDLRRQWEKHIPIIEILDTHPSHRTIYWVVKTPIGADDRDFVQYMTHGQDEQGTMYILYKNAIHPHKPHQKGIVRAETLFSGTLIYPDKEDPLSTRLTLVVQDDIKGYVPKTILNYFYTKAPIEWHGSITNYYHNVYKKSTHVRT